MSHKAGARKRWKKAIDTHIEAVPGSIVKSFITLTYRLRGAGYEYDEETDHWYYILEEDRREAAIKAYQAERAEAKRIQDEETHRKKALARKKKVRISSIAA